MLSEEKLTISAYARGYLLRHKEITDIVGARIFPGVAPEKTPSPFIVYERDAYATFNTKFGVYKEEAVIVFEVVSGDYDSGMNLIVAIHRILQGKHGGFKFEVVDSTEYYKEGKFRQIIIFKIT